jgi:hypothetical protein
VTVEMGLGCALGIRSALREGVGGVAAVAGRWVLWSVGWMLFCGTCLYRCVCGDVSCPGSHWDWVELGRISVKEMSSPLLPSRLVCLVITFYLFNC